VKKVKHGGEKEQERTRKEKEELPLIKDAFSLLF